MDFQESLFFYSLPPLFFLNSLYEFKNDRHHLSPLSYFFQGILVLIFLLSTILSINPGGSYYYLWGFITILLIINLATIYIVDLEQFFSITLFFSLVYSLSLIASKFGLIQLPTKELGDNFVLQVWGHSYLGNFLLLPIVICFYRLNPKKLPLYGALIILFTISLFLSQSRSGVIGTIIALLITPSISKIQKWSKMALVIIFALVLGALLIFSTTKTALYKSADGSRPIFWRQAISGIQKSPIFGNGPATFAIINRQFKKPHEDITNTTHNSVLEFLTNNGSIFTIIFLFYLLWGLKIQKSIEPVLFSIGLGLFVSSLFDSFLSFPGFLILLLITATYRNPNYYHHLGSSRPTKFILGIASLLIFSFSLFKTGSDIAYWRQNYSLSVKLDQFNLNSLLQIHDRQTIQKMTGLFPHEVTALLSAIEYTKLPESIPYYNHLFETNPQITPYHYIQLGKYYNEVHRYSDLEQLLNKFDYQFYEKNDSLPQLEIGKLYYFLSITKWRENKPQEAINLAKKSIYYSNGWSHFHIELANMYWYTDQKDLATAQLLTQCHLYPPSISACDNYLNENKSKFLTPGSPEFFKDIEILGE
jgi:hypothetical protein